MTAAEVLQENLNAGAFAADHAFLIQKVLQELDEYRAERALAAAEKKDAERAGFSAIRVFDDLLIPNGQPLTRHARVRFKTGPGLNDYLEARMPTTRDNGWIEVSAGDFNARPTVQLRGGSLMLRAVRGDI